jgi:hypothetical protein
MNLVRGTRRWAVALLLVAVGSCTKFLDHSAIRCNTDEDCFGYSAYHPYCRAQVCVASGLAPPNCFFATPSNPPVKREDFLNQCSTGFLPSNPNSKVEECLSDNRNPDPDAGIRMPPARAMPPPTMATRPTAMCKDLVPPGATPVYLSGSSNFQPLLGELAPAIVARNSIVPIFRITTSCSGAHSQNPGSPDHMIKDPTLPSEAYAQIFLGNSITGVSCLLGTAGVPVDIGESEIFPDSCEGGPNPAETVLETLGPILPLLFVVPPGSQERAISFATARQVFGNGGGVAPWTDDKQIFARGNGTATLRLLAKELELTPAQVWGLDQGNANAMGVNIANTTDPAKVQSTIGIIGADFYDSYYRSSIKPLAFQAKGQSCAYVPDSDLRTKDKINVRDGHYPLWGRIHFFITLSNGSPVSDAAGHFVFLLTGAKLDPEVLQAFVTASFIPACAMKVKRMSELSELLVDDPPPYPCGCAFDKLTSLKNEAPARCQACKNGECTDPAFPSCNFDFCEPIRL